MRLILTTHRAFSNFQMQLFKTCFPLCTVFLGSNVNKTQAQISCQKKHNFLSKFTIQIPLNCSKLQPFCFPHLKGTLDGS